MSADSERAINEAEGLIHLARQQVALCHPSNTENMALTAIANALCGLAVLLHAAFTDEFGEDQP